MIEHSLKIAVPLFGNRVAPRFDYAEFFLIAGMMSGSSGEVESTRYRITGSPFKRISELKDMGVKQMICGGISMFSLHQLAYNGIRVVDWVTGDAEDVLRRFLTGDSFPESVTEKGPFINRRRLGGGTAGFGQRRWPLF